MQIKWKTSKKCKEVWKKTKYKNGILNSEKKIWNLPFYEILHNIFRYILAAEIYAILKPWNLDILKY